MALREVNLVPESILQRRYRLRHGTGWALAGVLTAVLLGASLIGVQGLAARRRLPVSEEHVRKQLAATIAEIEAKKEEIGRLALVRDLSSPFGPADILGRLARALDSETWLTQVTLRPGDGNTRLLMMDGLAFSNSKLGTTIRSLTADVRFQDVVLKKSSRLKQASGAGLVPDELVQFSIEAKVLSE